MTGSLPPIPPPSGAREGAPTPGRGAGRGTPDKAREVSQEFEAFFLSQVLDQMFKGIKSDGLFGGGIAEGAYREMLNDEYARVISRTGGIGIADAVYREILRLQEVEE